MAQELLAKQEEDERVCIVAISVAALIAIGGVVEVAQEECLVVRFTISIMKCNAAYSVKVHGSGRTEDSHICCEV